MGLIWQVWSVSITLTYKCSVINSGFNFKPFGMRTHTFLLKHPKVDSPEIIKTGKTAWLPNNRQPLDHHLEIMLLFSDEVARPVVSHCIEKQNGWCCDTFDKRFFFPPSEEIQKCTPWKLQLQKPETANNRLLAHSKKEGVQRFYGNVIACLSKHLIPFPM